MKKFLFCLFSLFSVFIISCNDNISDLNNFSFISRLKLHKNKKSKKPIKAVPKFNYEASFHSYVLNNDNNRLLASLSFSTSNLSSNIIVQYNYKTDTLEKYWYGFGVIALKNDEKHFFANTNLFSYDSVLPVQIRNEDFTNSCIGDAPLNKYCIWVCNCLNKCRTSYLSGLKNVVVSNDNRYIAFSSYELLRDFNVRVWDLKLNKKICDIVPHSKYFNTIAFLKNTNNLILGSTDSLKIIDLAKCREKIIGENTESHPVFYSKDLNLFTAGSTIYNADSLKPFLKIKNKPIAFSPDMKYFYSRKCGDEIDKDSMSKCVIKKHSLPGEEISATSKPLNQPAELSDIYFNFNNFQFNKEGNLFFPESESTIVFANKNLKTIRKIHADHIAYLFVKLKNSEAKISIPDYFNLKIPKTIEILKFHKNSGKLLLKLPHNKNYNRLAIFDIKTLTLKKAFTVGMEINGLKNEYQDIYADFSYDGKKIYFAKDFSVVERSISNNSDRYFTFDYRKRLDQNDAGYSFENKITFTNSDLKNISVPGPVSGISVSKDFLFTIFETESSQNIHHWHIPTLRFFKTPKLLEGTSKIFILDDKTIVRNYPALSVHRFPSGKKIVEFDDYEHSFLPATKLNRISRNFLLAQSGKMLNFYNIKTGKRIWGKYCPGQFDSTDNLLITTDFQTIKTFSLPDGKLKDSFLNPWSEISEITIISNGKYVVLQHYEGILTFIDIKSFNPVLKFYITSDGYWVALLPHGVFDTDIKDPSRLFSGSSFKRNPSKVRQLLKELIP